MSEFKVGDVVRCIDGSGSGGDLAEDATYEVLEAAVGSYGRYVRLEGSNGEERWWKSGRFQWVDERFDPFELDELGRQRPMPDPWAEEIGGADEIQGLKRHLDRIHRLMNSRHQKYGPGNIAEFGDFGILVRMADKFARLKNGQQDHSDETVRDTLDDIIGYSLIWLLWAEGSWPGSPNDPFASRADAE